MNRKAWIIAGSVVGVGLLSMTAMATFRAGMLPTVDVTDEKTEGTTTQEAVPPSSSFLLSFYDDNTSDGVSYATNDDDSCKRKGNTWHCVSCVDDNSTLVWFEGKAYCPCNDGYVLGDGECVPETSGGFGTGDIGGVCTGDTCDGTGGLGGGSGGNDNDSDCDGCLSAESECLKSAARLAETCRETMLRHGRGQCEASYEIDGSTSPASFSCPDIPVVNIEDDEWIELFDYEDLEETCTNTTVSHCVSRWLNGIPGSTLTGSGFTLQVGFSGFDALDVKGTYQSSKMSVTFPPSLGTNKQCAEMGKQAAAVCASHRHACEEQNACWFQ